MVALGRRLKERCRGTLPPDVGFDFYAWKNELVRYSGITGKESLPGLASKVELAPALRADLHHLRFSGDGSLLLAQDDATLFGLRSSDLAIQFRVDVPGASPAVFSPDSRTVSFSTPDLKFHRLELGPSGDIARETVSELFLRDGCRFSALRPSGDVVACVSPSGDLRLVELLSGRVMLEEREFSPPVAFISPGVVFFSTAPAPGLGFSPDGRFFVAGVTAFDRFRAPNRLLPPPSHSQSFPDRVRLQRSAPDPVGLRAETRYAAFDFETMKPFDLPGSIRDRVGRSFVFAGSDRIVGIHKSDPAKSAVLTFPKGEILDELPLGHQSIDVPSRGNFLFLRPIRQAAVGVMDLSTKKIFLASEKPAFDMHEDLLAHQPPGGEVELMDYRSRATVASVDLPSSPLGALWTFALSSDSKWVAISGTSRGGVWRVDTGERRLETRGFESGWFDELGRLYAVFPAEKETPRMVGILEAVEARYHEGLVLENADEYQHGSLILSLSPGDDGRVALTAPSIRSGATLFRLAFGDEVPRLLLSPAGGPIALLWSADGDHARAVLESDERLKRQHASATPGTGQLVDAYELPAQTPMVRAVIGYAPLFANGFVSGGRLFLWDDAHRVLAYSLESGERSAVWLGSRPLHSPALDLVVVQRAPHELAVYPRDAIAPSRVLSFASPVAAAGLSGDGRRLLVLSADQKMHVLDLE